MTAALFLADTNVLVHLVAARSERLRYRIEQQPHGAVVTSTLCVAEALFGANANDQALDLQRLLTQIEPLPFDRAAADACAMVPFRRGRLDRLIAAHALSLDLTVITGNEADFADIPGLRVENWSQ